MEPDSSPATVMVVDDTPANLKLLAEMLTSDGYRVVQFPDAERARRAAIRTPPDLILLDILMPEVDGFELCRQLKAEEATREIPVIFVSALDDSPHKLRGFAEGGVDYVTRIFREEEVLARVGTHLRIVSLRKQLRAHNKNLERVVAERTRELDRACQRLLELDRLKDDFFSMIAREIRTRTNSILGIGEILLERGAVSKDDHIVKDLFQQSARRLCNSIDDAALIADLHLLEVHEGVGVSLGRSLQSVGESPDTPRIKLDDCFEPETMLVCDQPELWEKVLETVVSLAACFCQDPSTVRLCGEWESPHYCLRIDLDAFSLDQEEADALFEIEATVRSASPAESLGLGPVVAHKLLTAFGGSLKLIAADGETGCLEARLPVVRVNQD